MTKTSSSLGQIPQMAYYVYQKRVALKNPFSEESATPFLHSPCWVKPAAKTWKIPPKISSAPVRCAGCIKLPRRVFVPAVFRPIGRPGRCHMRRESFPIADCTCERVSNSISHPRCFRSRMEPLLCHFASLSRWEIEWPCRTRTPMGPYQLWFS